MQLSEVNYGLTVVVKSYSTVILSKLVLFLIHGIDLTPTHWALQQVG